jgi:hypothetical protein
LDFYDYGDASEIKRIVDQLKTVISVAIHILLNNKMHVDPAQTELTDFFVILYCIMHVH